MLHVFFDENLGLRRHEGPCIVSWLLRHWSLSRHISSLHCYKCCWQQRLRADNRSSFIMHSSSSPPIPSLSPPLQQLVDKWCACVEWNATPPIRTVPSDVLTTVDVEASLRSARPQVHAAADRGYRIHSPSTGSYIRLVSSRSSPAPAASLKRQCFLRAYHHQIRHDNACHTLALAYHLCLDKLWETV